MAERASILIVEDEEDLRDIIVYNLDREGYHTIVVGSGEQGLEQALAEHPDLILLDLMLPGMNGMDVCRRLKQDATANSIPIIMVSAKGEEADIVSGLELGADDYLVKPFSPRILLARIRAVLRRIQQPDAEEESVVCIDGLIVDANKFQVSIDGSAVELTKSEFSILFFLASHKGWVFTRYQIVDAIRGEKYVVTERSVDVQITGLRKKLGDYSKLIETVRGVGYRFKE